MRRRSAIKEPDYQDEPDELQPVAGLAAMGARGLHVPNQTHMRFLTLTVLAAAFLITAASSRAQESEWKACSDPQFLYVLKYPPVLTRLEGAAPTGCSFQTPDGDFAVEAVAENPTGDAAGETLDGRMTKELELMGDTVTYKTSGESWFVISGVTSDGTEYYRKGFTNGSQWISLRITYPHARNDKFDPWVKRIEKSFVAFAKADINDSE